MQCPICRQILKKNKDDFNNTIYICENKHSFDVSKYGYVNLSNKSNSGDNKEMVKNRHLFLNKNYYLKLAVRIKEIIKELKVNNILDIGCGEGYFDRIIKDDNINITGLDISKDAVLCAAKSDKSINYVVASAFKIPFIDNYFDLILSIFAPIDCNEASRVCDNYLIKVIPNKNHLIELKHELYDNVYENNILKENIDHFDLIKEEYIEYHSFVDDVNELFKMTPYYYSTHNNFEIKLESMDITFSFIIRLYKRHIS